MKLKNTAHNNGISVSRHFKKKQNFKLKIILENLDWTKKNGILIIGICLSAMLIRQFLEYYRGTLIYQYGAPLSLFIFYGGVFWSFINTLQLISKYKTDLKKNILWIFISAIPFLYIFIMMTIAMTKTV